MGLTIQYSLRIPKGSDPGEVIEKLRQAALDLPVDEVSNQVFHLVGPACDWQQLEQDHPLRWALIQAQDSIEAPADGVQITVSPVELYLFTVSPGEGCEEANFGLARYPDRINWRDRELEVPDSGVWHWRSFCKTQYASTVSIEHFVRCHVAVCCLLREAERLGVLEDVDDEGGFWDTWDVSALVQAVNEYNVGMAGMVKGLEQSGIEVDQAAVRANPEYPVLRELGNAGVGKSLAELLRKYLKKR